MGEGLKPAWPDVSRRTTYGLVLEELADSALLILLVGRHGSRFAARAWRSRRGLEARERPGDLKRTARAGAGEVVTKP